MDRCVLVYDGGQKEEYTSLIQMIEDVLKKEGVRVETLSIESGLPTEYINCLEETPYAWVIDLAGSQIRTLLDDMVYNVIRAMQIHLVVDVTVMDVYKLNGMALNLYLFLPEDERERVKQYSHVPNLLTYSSFSRDYKGRPIDNDNNRNVIRTIYHQFIKDVRG